MRMKKLLSSGAGLLLALVMTLAGSAAALASSNIATTEVSPALASSNIAATEVSPALASSNSAATEVSAAVEPSPAPAHIGEWVALIIGGRYEEAENFSPLHPELRQEIETSGGMETFAAALEQHTGDWKSAGEFEFYAEFKELPDSGIYLADLTAAHGSYALLAVYAEGQGIADIIALPTREVLNSPVTVVYPQDAEPLLTPPSEGASPQASANADVMPRNELVASSGAPDYNSQIRFAPPVPMPVPEWSYPRPYTSGEEYLDITENPELSVAEAPLTTFSLKVDTASYRNVARYIEDGRIPPADAVRVEELINYFSYGEPLAENDTPFSIYTEVGPSPFDEDKEIVFVRVKSKEIDRSELPNSNLTFLIDTSGSMNSSDKLPLLKSSFALLVENLTEEDTVSIVTYAGSSSVVLDSVSGGDKSRILKAIFDLEASGSTAGGSGIITAYELAEKNFDADGNNRVLLATDGDFNVGVSSVEGLEELISDKRDTGIYLSVLGFGTGNLKDNRMETLAANGNGNYGYIDSIVSAQRTLVDELGATLHTVADDVKAQIEFNPAQVSGYRLIGYENRMLANEDFADDTKDAGEVGAGTDVVLLFEITRKGKEKEEIPLKYQPKADAEPVEPEEDELTAVFADELMEVRIRYKEPGEDESQLIIEPVTQSRYLDVNTEDFNFAVSVAGWGHLLKDSDYKGDITIDWVLSSARDSAGEDADGYREEFISLLEEYKRVTRDGWYYHYWYKIW